MTQNGTQIIAEEGNSRGQAERSPDTSGRGNTSTNPE